MFQRKLETIITLSQYHRCPDHFLAGYCKAGAFYLICFYFNLDWREVNTCETESEVWVLKIKAAVDLRNRIYTHTHTHSREVVILSPWLVTKKQNLTLEKWHQKDAIMLEKAPQWDLSAPTWIRLLYSNKYKQCPLSHCTSRTSVESASHTDTGVQFHLPYTVSG